MSENGYPTGIQQAKTFVSGLLLGSAIGAGAALLGAPRSGKKTRKQIQQKASAVRDKAEQTVNDVRERVEEAGQQVTHQVSQQAEEARERVGEVGEDVSQRVDEFTA